MATMKDIINSERSSFSKAEAGYDIFSYGENAEDIYLLIQGMVALYKQTSGGEESEQESQYSIVEAGGFFGESALKLETRRQTRAKVISREAAYVSCPVDEFQSYLPTDNPVNVSLLDTLSKRIEDLEKPLDTVSFAVTDYSNINEQEEKMREKSVGFFLEGHGHYPQKAPEKHEHYLYEKEIECPVCDSRLKVKKLRKSRLRLEKMQTDLRPIYKDFESIWYRIWVCPACFYAAPRMEFKDLRPGAIKKIKSGFKEAITAKLGDGFSPGYSTHRSLNEVFTNYYLSLALFDFIGASSDKAAGSWVRLSWLYEDLDEPELAEEASRRAFSHLERYYLKEYSGGLSMQAEYKLILLLSDLYITHGDPKKAQPLLDKIIRKAGVKSFYKELARDKFIAIREHINKENNS